MLKRLKYLISYFCIVWGFFILQKPVFMLCNASKDYCFSDYIEVMLHGASLDATTTGYMTILPFILSIISIWCSSMPLRKIIMPYYIICVSIVSVVFVADLSLFAFWESKLDASVFVYIDSPKNAMASVSCGYILFRVFAIVFITVVVCAVLCFATPIRFDCVISKRNRLLATLCAVPLGAILFVVIRGGVRVSTANVGNAYFCSDQYLNLSAINPTFNLLASMERQAKYEDEFNFYHEDVRNTLMHGLYSKKDSLTVNVLNTPRPNVLIIFMESFGATMIERLGGAKDVAPCLNKLSDEGIFFSNVYANSFRTDRGTVCVFSGYPGLPTLSIMKVSNLSQNMPNIAASFDRVGYTTDFLYGGDINFTNMRGYLLSGGFRQLTSQDDFPMSYRNYSKWGVPDGITFSRLFDILKSRKDSGKPWFTAFLTLSSHEPFEVPYKKFSDKHFNAFAYTDHCIGNFISRFRKTPQWKNTLVILLPDHGIPYPKVGERFGPRYFKIPMIWTGGAVSKKMVYAKIMNQTDLAATLLAQLGIDHSNFDFSRNVFSKSYKNPFAFYSFVNGFGFLDKSGFSVYDNLSGKVFYSSSDKTSDDSVRVRKGKAILQTLYDRIGELNKERYN